ncbi:MAG: hypothetical protein GYA46_06645 [candidate division Zixibacteria bacterium]|nr:hypothetical protein [candidate division Zixibacteria bacterium]
MKKTLINFVVVLSVFRFLAACTGDSERYFNTESDGKFTIPVPESATEDDKRRIGLMAVSKPILYDRFIYCSLPQDVVVELADVFGDSIFREIQSLRQHAEELLPTRDDATFTDYMQTHKRIFYLFDSSLTYNRAITLVERCHIPDLQVHYLRRAEREDVIVEYVHGLGTYFFIDLKTGVYFTPLPD